MRDRVPPGKGRNIFLRAGWKPERAETRNPGRDPRARQAALKRSVGGRRQPGPAQPAAPNFFTSGRIAARRKEFTCPAVSSAPALWFGANAGWGVGGGTLVCSPRRRRRRRWSAAGRAQEVKVFANGPIETALTLWGGSRNSRANRSMWTSRFHARRERPGEGRTDPRRPRRCVVGGVLARVTGPGSAPSACLRRNRSCHRS